MPNNAFLSKPREATALFATLGDLLHIKWRYAAALDAVILAMSNDSHSKPSRRTHVTSTSPHTVRLEFLRAARMGNICRVLALANILCADNMGYAPFVNELDAFIAHYQMPRLCTWLEHQYLTTARAQRAPDDHTTKQPRNHTHY